MNPIDTLLELFKINKDKVNDNLMNTIITQVIEFSQIPTYNEISSALNKFNKRDFVEIYMRDETDESISITSNSNNESIYNKFVQNNEGLDTRINVNINIKKNTEDKRISIFNIDTFLRDFIGNSLINNLKFFHFRFSYNSNIIFVNYDNDYMFNTNSMVMINNDKDVTINTIDRDELLDRCNSVSNFVNNIEYSLLPNDFSIITTNMNNEFIERLKKIKIIFSLLYIADYSAIDDENIKLKLNGYRNKDYLIKIKDFNYLDKYEEFYKIYEWIFQDANECDKVALTRNVISMYCKYTDILDIDEKTFLAIKSNYNIYLKENVDKYIELKKELTSFIMNTSNQINDIIGNFIDNFEKNIVAFITFILGTIIANIVSDTPLNNIFTKDIITIILVILLGSLFYLLITIIETYYRFSSYKKNYDDLKESYRDILDEQDIVTIFKNDKEYLKNKKNVKKITVIFSILWITLVIIAFISMVLNYNSEYVKKVIDILYKIVKCI